MNYQRRCDFFHIDKLLRVTEKSPTMVLHLAIHRLTQGFSRALQRCGISSEDKVTMKTDTFKLVVTSTSKALQILLKFEDRHLISITVMADGKTVLQGEDREAIDKDLRRVFEKLFQLSKKKSQLPVKIKRHHSTFFTEAKMTFSKHAIAFKRSSVKKK